MKHLHVWLCLFFSVSVSAQNRYIEPVFDQVTRTNDVHYGTNATVLSVQQFGEAVPQTLLLDVYEPTGDTALSRPLILVLPGGNYLPPNLNGLCEGAKNDSAVVEICTRLAKMGYVAAAVSYRLSWNPLSPNQVMRMYTYINAFYRGVQDARTAVRFFKKSVVEEANIFRVDTSRIVLWGESSGGQVALGAAYANAPADWVHPSLVIAPPNVPAILPYMVGDLAGTSTGVVDAAGNALTGLPVGDTLCYPNWPGYSSDFQLCVSMGGASIGIPWINAGEMPSILFHAPNDATIPCGDGMFIVQPPINLPVVAASGSCSMAAQLDIVGNNQVFWDADINDCVSSNAAALNGGLEGFYPFVGLPADKSRPWAWTNTCANNPNAPTDGAFARQYLDTIFAYFAPRACASLGLCNAQPDPGGLCGTQTKGQAFLDVNQNGVLDSGEQPFPQVVVELQPGGFHAASGLTGKFSISVPSGDYTLDVPSPPDYYALSNTPAAVTVPLGADAVQNIGLYPTATVNDLQVSITAAYESRPGFYNAFLVKWKNVGTTQLSGLTTVTVDANYFIEGSTPSASIVGNTATWEIVNLPPLQSGSAWLQVSLPTAVPLGVVLNTMTNALPTGVADETPQDNVASISQTVIGSFDPNDKQVTPAGDVTEGILLNHGGWLDYTVRFQNTGTASAINVYIVDTLSELLNTNTLEIVGASHSMRWEISGQRTVTWFFDQINLPDSLANEPESHGFVRYRIKPAGTFGSLLNKTVRNFADIYFDFNAPVRTNTTETKFTQNTAVHTAPETSTLSVVPNPARDGVSIVWAKREPGHSGVLRIVNTSGTAVLQQKLSAPNPHGVAQIDVQDWPKGIYFVQLSFQSGTFSTKFVKN